MITLVDVLIFLNYNATEQQLSFVKLLAYRGGFGDPRDFNVDKEYEPSIYQNFVNTAYSIWKNTRLDASYSKYKNQLINDNEAQHLLKINFQSLEEGFVWLHNTAEIFLLRKGFFLEGTNPKSDSNGINTKKWEHPEEKKSINTKLYQLAKTLNLVGNQAWPTNKSITHVVLFSSVNDIVKNRIQFIDKHFTGIFDCLTGPRGLFNFESEVLAPILAEWFDEPSKVNIIKSILDKYQNDQCELQWTKNLTDLKKAILSALNKTQWPKVPDSYYYQDKKIYDTAADEAKRERLDCLGGPWPVAMDLIHYYAKKHFLNFNKITLRPVVALGKNGRLAGVDDELKLWYSQYGKKLIANGKMPVFIACNSIHAIPFILNRLMYATYYQEELLQRSLFVKSDQFRMQEEEKKESKIELCTLEKPLILGPGPIESEFDLQHALDAIAKSLFCINQNLKENIGEYVAIKRQIEQKLSVPERIIDNIRRHLKNQKYLKVSDSALDLGIFFHIKRDLIKASGLLNFSQNVLKYMNDKDLNYIIHSIYEFTITNINCFIALTLKEKGINSPVDIQLIKKFDQANKINLANIRKKLLLRFNKISIHDVINISNLYQLCFEEMRVFIKSIMEQSVTLLSLQGIPYSLIFHGSHSKGIGTPFSDIESSLVTLNPYMKTAIKLQLLKILNLGETVLPSMGISGLDLGEIYDHCTPQGVSFDRVCGGITPLGMKKDGKRIFSLTGSAQELAEVANNTIHNFYLPQILRSMRQICGSTKLYTDFLSCLNKSSLNLSAYGFAILRKDLDQCINYLDRFLKTKSAKHKNFFFRPLIIIDDLYFILNKISEINPYQKVLELFKYGILTEEQKISFIQNITIALYMRFKQVFKFSEQKTDISIEDKEFPVLYQSQEQMKKMLENFRALYDSYDRELLYKEQLLSRKSLETSLSSKIIFFKPLEVKETKFIATKLLRSKL